MALRGGEVVGPSVRLAAAMTARDLSDSDAVRATLLFSVSTTPCGNPA